MTTKSNTNEDYHTELRVLMLRKGITQRELARALNVDHAYLCRVLTGARAGHRLRNRLVLEFGFPTWLLNPLPRRQRKAA